MFKHNFFLTSTAQSQQPNRYSGVGLAVYCNTNNGDVGGGDIKLQFKNNLYVTAKKSCFVHHSFLFFRDALCHSMSTT